MEDRGGKLQRAVRRELVAYDGRPTTTTDLMKRAFPRLHRYANWNYRAVRLAVRAARWSGCARELLRQLRGSATNWSVHSQSARELVSGVFRRQATDPNLTRGKARRAAMMALVDGKGYTDESSARLFSYAQPL